MTEEKQTIQIQPININEKRGRWLTLIGISFCLTGIFHGEVTNTTNIISLGVIFILIGFLTMFAGFVFTLVGLKENLRMVKEILEEKQEKLE